MRIALFVGGPPTLTEAWLIEQVAGLIVVSGLAVRPALGLGSEKPAHRVSMPRFVGLVRPFNIVLHRAYLACQRNRALIAINTVHLLAVVVGASGVIGAAMGATA